MKKLLFTLLIGISTIAFAQAPQEISYQGVARNVNGTVLANQAIGIKLDLHQGSTGGTIVFSESHNKTTNSFGLFTLGIGSVNTAGFTSINWANGSYFLEVSMDPTGGSSYISVGIQQFMSVPYALYAASAPAPSVTFTNNILSVGGNTTTIASGTTYTAGSGIIVSGNTITNSAPDQIVTLTPAGSASVSGTYPNFTINTPTTQVYSAGNGIDVTNGVISNTAAVVTPTIVGTGATTVNGVYPNLTINTPTIAPDQTVTLLGINAATVTGTYPNFTVDVPNGTLLPTGLNGQLLFNNGTVWDTIPQNSLFYDVANNRIGMGTNNPQSDFHVAGAGRFDASVATRQIYTDSIKITGSVAGLVLTSDAIGNGTWQSLPVNSSTISIVGSGLATVSPTTGSTFTVSVPNPTISIASGSLSISNGNSVAIPSPSLTINSNSLTINGPGGNTVLLPPSSSQSLSINSNSISISGGNTITIPTTSVVSTNTNIAVSTSAGVYSLTAVTPTLTGTGATSVTGSFPSFTINSPTVAAAVTQTLTATGISSVTTGANTFTVNTPMPIYTSTTGVLSFGGTNTVVATPSLSIVGNVLRSGPASNTVVIPTSSTTTLTQGSNILVTGPLANYTVSAPAYSISLPGGNTVQITNGTSTSTAAINATSLTLTGVNNDILSAGGNTVGLNTYTVGSNLVRSGAAPNYTFSAPGYSLTSNSNTLTLSNGTAITTATMPALPLLSLSGSTLQSGPATNTVNLSSLSVWSNSVGVLYPTTLTNSLGIGTNGPLTDRTTINHLSNGTIGSVSTHLHLKQIAGGDAFSRIKFSNTVAPTKYWINSVISDATTDVNSGYNIYYFNGTSGNNLFTVAGDGRVSINPFGTLPNSILDVKGKIRLDSSLTMAAYTSPPAVSFGNEGRIYYDRSTNKFKVSENSGTYVDLITGGGSSPWIQGTGIITQTNLGDKVGIGTATPSSPLHVYGIADPLQIIVENAGGAFKTGYNIKTASQEWFIGKETGGSNGLRFSDITNGLVRMVIETSGNVGIGTNTPAYKLDISDNFSNTGGTSLNLLSNSSSTSGANSAVYSNLLGSSSGNYISGYFRSEALAGATGSPLGVKGLGVGNSSTSATGVSGNAMNGNQNTGVYGYGTGGSGTTNYGVFGEVAGPGFAGYFTGGPTLVDGKFVLWPQATVPTAFMGQGSFYYDNTSNQIMVAENSTTYKPLFSGWGLSGNSLTGTEFLGSSNGQDVVFKAAGTELMRLKSSNAITFTAGQYSMTASTAVNPALTITGPNFASTQLNLKTSAAVTSVGNLGSLSFSDGNNSTTQAYIQGMREAGGGIVGDLPTALVFYTTPDGSGTEAERMRISNNGRVGIGVSSPSAMLHVVSAATSTVGLWVDNGHVKATGGSVTVGLTNAVGGFSALAAPSILPNSNDVKGAFSFSTGVTGFATTNYAEIEIKFSKNYSLAPIVALTPLTDLQGLDYLVTNVTTTSFFVRVYRSVNVTVPITISGTPLFKFNYIVIE
jgi:hypothetical protein